MALSNSLGPSGSAAWTSCLMPEQEKQFRKHQVQRKRKAPVKGTLMNGNTHLNKTRGRMPLVLLGECCFSQHTAARASYPPRILPESEGRKLTIARDSKLEACETSTSQLFPPELQPATPTDPRMRHTMET